MKNVPINLQDYIEEKLLRYQPQKVVIENSTKIAYVPQHLFLLVSVHIGQFYIQKN